MCVCVCVFWTLRWHRKLKASLQWRHNERNGVSNHQPHDCLLNRLFSRRSKKTPKLRVTGLCEGNSPVICEFPAQRASNVETFSIWWRHHVFMDGNGRFSLQSKYHACRWSGDARNQGRPKKWSYQYRDSYYKDKTVSRPSYLYGGNPYT